jgi:hypothetical protein
MMACQGQLDIARVGKGASPVMHSALWSGVLTLAIVAGVAAPRQMHLHTANGARAGQDAHHQGDVDEPLLHGHASPHHHESPAPEQGEPEDVLALVDGILIAGAPCTPDLVMMNEGPVALSPPPPVDRPLIVHQPPSHAPPPSAAVGSRAPPPAFS